MLLVDVIIVAVVALYAYFGYRQGFLRNLAELLMFAVSFLLALLAYHPVGDSLVYIFRTPAGVSDLISFTILWLALELGLLAVWHMIQRRIPPDVQHSTANRLAGIVPAALKGLVLVTVLLLIMATAPVSNAIKQPWLESFFGHALVSLSTGAQQQFNMLFGDALKETLAFKTIKTEGSESVPLGFTSDKGKDDPVAEQKMLDLVNQERLRRGLEALRFDAGLRDVGRAHSQDMVRRGYFSHNTPEGVDPFQRVERAGITYEFAGENLAFAPTTEIAFDGLMNSPGHRANMLNPDFTRLGVGAVDAGLRGKMFSQEFTG